jgi:hypothetical protein
MTKAFLEGKEAEEYKRLQEHELPAALQREIAVLYSHGMDSAEFREASEVTSRLHRRIRELLRD